MAWSSYKHHNVFKFLVACTPNGAISYISLLYLGSVSDPQLTRDCGFLEKLEGMSGASVMADRGFTIKETLFKLGIGLNLPPFMEGRRQLLPMRFSVIVLSYPLEYTLNVLLGE